MYSPSLEVYERARLRAKTFPTTWPVSADLERAERQGRGGQASAEDASFGFASSERPDCIRIEQVDLKRI